MTFSSGALSVLPAITSPVTATDNGIEVQQISLEVKSEDYMPLTDPKNVEKFLNDYFAATPILAKIGKCESRNRHYNSRGEVLRGEKNTYDRGVMQINLLYHEKDAVKLGLDLHNIDDNVAYARYLYEKQGAKPWMSSSACWSKFAVGKFSESDEVAKK